MARLLVDDRERQVTPHLEILTTPECGWTLSIERLYIGDYSVSYNGKILLCIERKTWSDLASSFKDNRIRNLQNMLDLRKETGCKVAYLIEGQTYPREDKKFSRIPFKSLRAHLDHTIFRDDVHIIYTKNAAHTSKRLVELLRNLCSCKEIVATIAGGGEKLLRTYQPPSDDMIIYNMWATLPHITARSAALMMKHMTLSKLINGEVTVDEVAAIKYPSGIIVGEKRARRILDIDEAHCAKLLAAIPLITVKTAQSILDKYDIKDICNGKVSIDDLANVKKSDAANSRRVGPAAAKNILKYIST